MATIKQVRDSLNDCKKLIAMLDEDRIYTKGSAEVEDGLQPPSTQMLNEFRNNIKKMGFVIESEKKTFRGGVHFQIKYKDKETDAGMQKRIAMRVDKVVSDIEHKYDSNSTYNVGIAKDGTITAGVDIRDMFVKDSKTVDMDSVSKSYMQKAIYYINRVKPIYQKYMRINKKDREIAIVDFRLLENAIEDLKGTLEVKKSFGIDRKAVDEVISVIKQLKKYYKDITGLDYID